MPHHSQCTAVSDKLESSSPPKSAGLSPASTNPSSKASESPDRSITYVRLSPERASIELKWPGLTAMTEDEEANLIPFVRWVVKHRTVQSSCAAKVKPIGKLESTLPIVASQLYEYQRREFWTVFYHHFYSMGCPPDIAIRDFVDGAKLIDWSKTWGHTTILGHSHTYLFLAHDQPSREPAIIPSGFMSRNARVAMLRKMGLSCPEPKRIPRTFAAAAKAKAQPKDLAFAFKDNGQSYMDRKVPVTLALPIAMESHGFDVDGVVHGEDMRHTLKFLYRMPGAESLCSIWMRDDATVGDAIRAITKRYCVTGCCLVAANPRPVHMATLICELRSVCDIVKAPSSACFFIVKADAYEDVLKSLSFEPADTTKENTAFLKVSAEIRPGHAVAMTNGQLPSYTTQFGYEASDHPLLPNWRCYGIAGTHCGFSLVSYWWNFSICDYGVGTTRLFQMTIEDHKMTPANLLMMLIGYRTVRQTDCLTLVRLLPGGKAEVVDLKRRYLDEDGDFLHYTDSLVLYVKPRLATKPFNRDPTATAYPVQLHCGGNTTELTFVADQPTEASIAKPLLMYLCRLWNLLPSVVAAWMVCVDQEAPPLPGRISITKVISNDIPRFEVFVNVRDGSLPVPQQQAPTKDASESLWFSPNECPEWNQHAAILQWMHASSDSELPFDKSLRKFEDEAFTKYRRRIELFYGVGICRSGDSYCCINQNCDLEHRCVFCDSCDHVFGIECRPWERLVETISSRYRKEWHFRAVARQLISDHLALFGRS